MGKEINIAPEITLLKSEMEAAAARVAERALNYTVDGVAGVLSDIFGGLVGDPIKQWRTRNLINALSKTKDHLEAHGISLDRAKALPTGELYSMFEGASKQDDPHLTEMWAALLSNAMNPEKKVTIDPSLVRILESLSGLDASILEYLLTYEREKAEADRLIGELKWPVHNFSDPDTPEITKARTSSRKINDDFRLLHAKLLAKIDQSFSPDLVSYGVSNLLRIGLINDRLTIDRHRPLVSISETRHDGYAVQDNELKDILQAIIDTIDTKSEDGTLNSLTFTPHHSREDTVPAYHLSGLGKRFLAACT